MENDSEKLTTYDRFEVYHKHCYCAGPKCCSCGHFDEQLGQKYPDWSM